MGSVYSWDGIQDYETKHHGIAPVKCDLYSLKLYYPLIRDFAILSYKRSFMMMCVHVMRFKRRM